MGGVVVSLLAVTALGLSACSSDDGGSGGSTPSSSSNSSAVPVAQGVEKDSVLDLNSTKDMTGVVTTVPIGESPYDKNMPDICNFITPAAMQQLGVETKKKAFVGTPLIYQACAMNPPLPDTNKRLITAEIYINNLQEHLSAPNLVDQKPSTVNLWDNVVGHVVRDKNRNKNSDGPYSCEIAWGTFYGTATLNLTDTESEVAICQRAVEDAKAVGPLMPKSPSEMRPTS